MRGRQRQLISPVSQEVVRITKAVGYFEPTFSVEELDRAGEIGKGEKRVVRK
jgi:hypothetical protein